MPAVSRALNDANSQLRRPDRGFAVALLCCNDMDEYADVMECLAGRNGIILGKEAENQIIARLEDLTNIDAVVVCLLGLGHRAMEDASHCRNVFRNVDIDLADGAEPWEYRASMPVGLILRAAEQSPDLQQEFQSAFRSHHVCLAELLDNGRELQEAIFEYYQSMLDANSTVGIAAKEVEAIQVLPEGSA